MAAHCKKHVYSGMAKGTVEHIKYCPDHTYTFLCHNSQPSPPASGSPADQILQQQPNKINQVPLVNYNPTLPYTGAPFISPLARSSFIFDDPTKDLISRIDTLPSIGNIQQYVGTEAGTSCSYGFDITMSQNPYGGGPSITPNRVRHNLDLTLGLNSTPSPAGDDATMNAMTGVERILFVEE
jgi:hypothetical protein